MTPRTAAAVALILPLVLGGAAVGACRGARPAVPAPAGAAPDTGATFDLAGVVRDEATGRPLPNTLVVAAAPAGERRTGTDATGAYRFADLPRGDYEVSARRVGYYGERRELSVRCPVAVLDAAGRRLSGGGPCDPARQTLNFLMREHPVR